MGAFQREVARLKLASDEVVRELADSFDAALRGSGMTLAELQKHFITHQGHAYLVAPNLYRCNNDQEGQKAIAINQVIGVLDEYSITTPMSQRERSRMWKADPRRISIQNFEQLEEDDDKRLIGRAFSAGAQPGALGRALGARPAPRKEGDKPDFAPLEEEIVEAFREGREAGVFAKARRALEVAGWSARARLVPELHKLKDGTLVPLLRVIEKAEAKQAAEAAEAAKA